MVFVTNTPEKNKRISAKERDCILQSLNVNLASRKVSEPDLHDILAHLNHVDCLKVGFSGGYKKCSLAAADIFRPHDSERVHKLRSLYDDRHHAYLPPYLLQRSALL